SDEELPLKLPDVTDFTPQTYDSEDAPPVPALHRADDGWKRVTIDGVTYLRELNTMPQWAGSCWYYLRYIDPDNSSTLVGDEAERYWMGDRGVDLYVGGVEHAVLHLLYARFWHKVLYDLGHVSTPEPFGRLFNQGYILADAFQDERGVYVPAEKVEHKDGRLFFDGKPVIRSHGKMGKSLKNSVSPDEMFVRYGVDTLRLYEMFMGPLDASKPWTTRDTVGVHRFLQRVWRNFVDEETGSLLVVDEAPPPVLERLLHRTVKVVTADMEAMRFNTAIARLFELNNALVPYERISREAAETFITMLGPFAPHIAEELWQRLGHSESVAFVPWPGYDDTLAGLDVVTMVLQVNGKVRDRVEVPADIDEKAAVTAALASQRVQAFLDGADPARVVAVPPKLVNVVV
ncbi:MAG: class I tRNA ligase family protein, partial [Acidimicrobiia bacterium]